MTDRLSDLIEEGFDCAIRVGSLKDSSFIARSIAWSRKILVCSPGVAEALPTLTGPGEMADCPTISFAPVDAPVRWLLENGGQSAELTPPGAITLGSLHAVREDAIAGGGVAPIPGSIAARVLKEGQLVQFLSDWTGPASPVNVIYPSRRHVSARLRAFVDLMEEALGEAPWGKAGNTGTAASCIGSVTAG